MSARVIQTGASVRVVVDTESGDPQDIAAVIAQTLVAGANVTLNQQGGQIVIAAIGGSSGGSGTVTSVSVAPANGITASVGAATTEPAISLGLGAITPASVSATGTVSGSNLSGINTGDQTSVTGNAGTATKLQTARTIALTGDVAYTSGAFDGSGNVTGAATLATVNGNVGTFGSATTVPVITVDGKGRITAVTTATVSGGGGGGDMFKADNLSGLANNATARSNIGAAAAGANTDITSITGSAARWTTGRTIGMTGDVTYTSASLTGAANVTGTATLATVNSNVGSFGSASSVPVITVDGKGRIIAASTAATAGVNDLSQPINFTAAADAYVPARVAMTIAQGNAPLGTGSVAYAKSTAASPSTFTTTTLPTALEAGAWLRVSATGVSGFLALDLYRSA